VHRQPHRLIDGKKPIGLIDALDPPNQNNCRPQPFLGIDLLRLRYPYGWQPKPLPGQEPLLRASASAINSYLAGSKHTVDTRLGHSFKVPQEKIIDSLAFVLGLDLKPIQYRHKKPKRIFKL
jgi:hypothetical protein